MHGDKDALVPLQQSETMVEKLKAAGVPAELIVKKGGDHGWGGILSDVDKFADWFDRYIGKQGSLGAAPLKPSATVPTLVRP
jgi:dipeptidyl aminopeptidase/acylaminoacyl peptidase